MAPTKKSAAKPPPKLSSARDLVPVGPRHLSSKYEGRLRTANGERPTTVRALVLRNGKYGARGTGELMAPSARMTGREKLELLAEELLKKSQTAVLSPFRLEHCLQIAESEYNDYIDNIKWLKDPEVFYDIIKIELITRTHSRDIKQLTNASHQATVVMTTIHNTYMFASAWQLIYATLQELQDLGLNDKDIKFDLVNNTAIQNHYLALYTYVNKLVELAHTQLSILAMTNPHWASYVTKNEYAAPDEADMMFDKQGLRNGARSFMDSIIIELLFPNSPYPKYILYSLLHEAVAESRKDAKKFSQPLWDAIGKLSELLKLQEILERPLKGPEGEKLLQLPVQMPEEYEQWVDAQLYSMQAAQEIGNFKDLISPLTKTKKKENLDKMWDRINENYVATAGEDIDSLWMLDGAFRRIPTWHCMWSPAFKKSEEEDTKTTAPRKQLALKDYAEDSDNSMPDLQSVSNSSDEEDEYESEEEDYEEADEEDGYNTEEEDELRDLLREAMDAAHEAGLFGADGAGLTDEQLAEDRKGNPFLKLLGSLRGRVFSSNPKLATQERKEPRKGYKPRPFSKPTTSAPPKPGTQPVHPRAQKQADAAPRSAASQADGPQSKKTTVEDVEDEDDHTSGPKKKKKKGKKKKRTSAEQANAMEEAFNAAQAPNSPPPTSPSLPQSPRSPPRPSSATSSFPLERTTTAQSAHSYLSENAPSVKQKVKSRTAQPTLFDTIKEETKSTFLSKFKKKREEVKVEVDQKIARKTWFNRLSKKATDLMGTLLHSSEDGRSSMKWEDFLRIMREMGFAYDPSTAGSSVRFDPPDPKDSSITFHKPHPDSTLNHVLLKRYGKRLKEYYGWDEQELLRRR